MPVFAAVMVQALGVAAGYLTWRVLSALGFGFVTYMGLDLLISGAETKIFLLIGELGPTAQGMFGVLRIGTCIKVWFAALAMRATLFGMADSGSVKRIVGS